MLVVVGICQQRKFDVGGFDCWRFENFAVESQAWMVKMAGWRAYVLTGKDVHCLLTRTTQ